MKKKLITLACFLLTVGLVTGCGLTKSTSPSSESSSSSGSEPISTSSEGPDSSSTSHYSSDSSSGRSEDISSSIMPDPSSSITPEPISSSSETPTPVSSSEKPEPSSSSEKPTPSSSSITPEPSSSSITPSPSSSSIAPIHTHNCVKIDGKAPTCTEDGWNDYWKCEDCGKFFTTEDATQEITDLETWKVGAGKLEAKGHKYEDTLSYASGVGKVVSTCSVCKDTKVTELGAPKTITGLLAVDEVAKLAEAKKGVSENYYCYKGRLTELSLYESSFDGVLSDGTSSFNLYKLVNSTGHDLIVGADLVVISKIKGYYGGVENSEGEALDLSLKESVVTVSKGEGYSTSIDDKTKAIIGDVISFTVTAKTGYFVTKVTCNGEKLNIENDGKYNVAVISEETNIEVTVSKSRPAEKAWVAAPNFAPVDGKKFLFTYESGETRKELSGISTTKTPYGEVADITGEDPAGLFPIRMQKNTEDDSWLLCVDVTGNEKTVTKYLSCTNANNLKLTEEPFSWAWDEKAGFSASFNDTTRSIQYNSSSPRFATYSSTQQKAQYYIENQTCTHASVTHHDAVAATCTVNGNKEYWTCNDCGAFFLDAEHTVEVNYFDDIFVKGEHHFDETKWESDGKGEFHYHVCSVCGEKQEESKTACTLKHVDALAPTCTEEGHGAYDYCEVCGYESEHEEHIAPLGHLNVHQVEKQDPTCVAEGHEAYWVCDREEGCCYEEYDSQTGKLTGPFDPTIEIDPENHDLHTVWNEQDTKAESTHTTSCFREGCTYTPVTEPCSFTKDESKSYPATESADGNIHWVCSKCEAEYDEVIPKVTHAKDVDDGILYDSETKSWLHYYTCHGGDNCPSHTTQPHTGVDQQFSIVEGDVVASIEDSQGKIHGYTSFSDAINASVNGDTIKVEAEIKLDAELVINANSKELTFDLNGHVITTAESYVGYYMIKVIAGTITFVDSGNGGSILAREGTDNIPLTAYANGHIIINSGTYGGQLNSSAVYVTYGNDAVPGNTADLVVNGGHFIFVDPETTPKEDFNIVNINIRNGYDLSHVSVNGGTFSADPSKGDDTLNGNYVNEGLCVAPVKGEFVVGSFEDLLANDKVDTINIVHDISIATEQLIDHDLTINLNGFTVTSTQATGRLFTVHKGAHLEINGQPSENNDTSAIVGTIRVGKATNDNGSLTINGGTYTSLEGKKQAAIQSNGTCTDCDIEINSATVKSEDDIAVYIGGGGQIKITNSDIEGNTGIYAKAGEFTISGSTIRANGDCVPVVGNSNGAYTNGNAIVLDSRDDYKGGDITLAIDNTIIVSEKGYGIYEVVTSGTKSKVKSITLGEEGAEPGIVESVRFMTELNPIVLSDKFEGAIDFNDTNVVSAVAKANKATFYYFDFVKAIEASENGDTVTNIVGIETEETIEINKSITIHFSESYNFTKESASAGKADLQYAFVITGDTKVTFVIDGLVKSASAFVGIYEGAKLTMNKGSADGAIGAIVSYYRVARVDSSSLTINNLTVTTECETGADATIALFGTTSSKAILEVNGAQVYNYGANSCVTSNGNNAGDYSTATLKDSKFVSGIIDENGDYVSGGDVAIYWPCGGTLTMTNCVASGLTGLYVKGGTVNITTSTFLGHGNYTGYKYSGGGCNATGDAIVVDNCNYPNEIKAFNIDAASYEASTSEKGSVIGSYAHGATTYEYPVTVPGKISETTTTFTSETWGDINNAWTCDNDATDFDASAGGVRIYKAQTGTGATSKDSFNEVTKVEFIYSTSSKGEGYITVTINGVSVDTGNVGKSKTNNKLVANFNTPVSGVVKFAVTCTTSTIYIKSITIFSGKGDVVIAGARNELKATIDAYKFLAPTYDNDVEVTLPTAPEGFTYSWTRSDESAMVIENNVLKVAQKSEAANYKLTLTATDKLDASFTYSKPFEFSVNKKTNYGTLDNPLTVEEALEIAETQCINDKDYSLQKVYVAGVVIDNPTKTSNTRYGEFNIKTSTSSSETLKIYSVDLHEGGTAPEKDAIVVIHGFLQIFESEYQISFKPGDSAFIEKINIPVKGVAISEKPEEGALEIAKGDSVSLHAVLNPITATDKEVTWSLDEGSEAFVSINVVEGVCEVTANNKGTAKVFVTTHDGNKQAFIDIEVTDIVPVESIKVSTNATNVEVGDEVVFTAEVKPLNSIQDVDWSISCEPAGCASIDASKTSEDTHEITVVTSAVGQFTVTASATDASLKTGSSTVQITKPVSKFTKVMNTADLTDGDYLIVYETGKVAFNGALSSSSELGGSKNSVPTGDMSGGVIAYSNVLRSAAVKYNSTDKTLQTTSGYYIGHTGNSNSLNANKTTKYSNDITISEGVAKILQTGSSDGYELRFNKASGTEAFRYYKNSQEKVALYKLDFHPVELDGLSFEEGTATTLGTGSTLNLTPIYSPEDATELDLVWSSDNPNVATVDENTGLITGVFAGTAVITATSANNEKVSASCTITVENVPVTGVTVTPESDEIGVGDTTKLTATVSPSDATVKTVTWSSNDESVATVAADGTVTGVAAGTATITATTTDGGFTSSCSVTVKGGSQTTKVEIGMTGFAKSSSTGYVSTPLTSEIEGISYTSNNLIPSTGQVKGKETAIASNWYLFNTTAFSKDLIKVTVTAGNADSNNYFKNKLYIVYSTTESVGSVTDYSGSNKVAGVISKDKGSFVFDLSGISGIKYIKICSAEKFTNGSCKDVKVTLEF